MDNLLAILALIVGIVLVAIVVTFLALVMGSLGYIFGAGVSSM